MRPFQPDPPRLVTACSSIEVDVGMWPGPSPSEYILISGQEKQTEKVEGRVQSAARYMRIADSSADVSAMQVVAGEDKLLSHVDSTLDNDLSRKRRGRTTLGCRVVSIPHYRWDVVFC